MKQFQDLKNILQTPDTMKEGDVDSRDVRELTDNSAVPAYKVPWEPYGHLANADADVIDAAWGVMDGKRDVRQLKKIKEL